MLPKIWKAIRFVSPLLAIWIVFLSWGQFIGPRSPWTFDIPFVITGVALMVGSIVFWSMEFVPKSKRY